MHQFFYRAIQTHCSLQVSKGLEYAVALIGALALQGGPIFWVAGYRMHYAYTEDIDKDLCGVLIFRG
ncbi:MAG TPA: hypothetical protein V6C46_09080 [Coleofasciculaceae cyanobacterium]